MISRLSKKESSPAELDRDSAADAGPAGNSSAGDSPAGITTAPLPNTAIPSGAPATAARTSIHGTPRVGPLTDRSEHEPPTTHLLRDQFISVIMPAYNEGHHIAANLEETLKLFDRVKCRYEIIVVDDGSSDDTYQQVLAVSRKDARVSCVALPSNQGKGLALQTGFRHSRGDYIVFLDSDLDLPPRQLIRMFKVMRDRQADVVAGSKRHPESTIEYPWGRRVISRIYYVILWILFNLPLNDTQCGLKIFRREALQRTLPYLLCKRYALDVELLANIHHQGFSISEAPVILRFRRMQRLGRMKFRDLYYTGLDTLAIFYRLRLLRYYDKAIARGWAWGERPSEQSRRRSTATP